MKRAFTMLELLLATLLVGILTTLSILTFQAVTKSWQTSTEYIDKLQRTDYALNQLAAGLRSAYYPHDGKQDERYGFVLSDNGDGESPDESDEIEWSKTGSAIIGNESALADTVHRIKVMVLEEGDSDYGVTIEKTGLYARVCGDSALHPKSDERDSPDEGYGFGNLELYQPILIADGVVGFNCRVMATAEEAESENDASRFKDEFAESNSIPYKVELTFYVADEDGRSYRTDTAPVMRIIRLPMHEQSLDGAAPAGAEEGKKKEKGGGK